MFVAHSSSARYECPVRAAEPAQLLLGRVRLAIADWLEDKGELQRPSTPHMLWVTDFPLFEKAEGDDGPDNHQSEWTSDEQHAAPRWSAMHHPFSAPIPEDEPRVLASTELGAVTGQCYDLVCNGAPCFVPVCDADLHCIVPCCGGSYCSSCVRFRRHNLVPYRH